MVPAAGLEPARHRWQWILSPPRLPIPTRRHYTVCLFQLPQDKAKRFLIIKHKAVDCKPFTMESFLNLQNWP